MGESWAPSRVAWVCGSKKPQGNRAVSAVVGCAAAKVGGSATDQPSHQARPERCWHRRPPALAALVSWPGMRAKSGRDSEWRRAAAGCGSLSHAHRRRGRPWSGRGMWTSRRQADVLGAALSYDDSDSGGGFERAALRCRWVGAGWQPPGAGRGRARLTGSAAACAAIVQRLSRPLSSFSAPTHTVAPMPLRL